MTYYDVLGVPSDASQEQVRQGYRRAVRVAHPDTGGTADSFTRVMDAWAVLGDPVRRASYDARQAPASPAGARDPRAADQHPARNQAGGGAPPRDWVSTSQPPPQAQAREEPQEPAGTPRPQSSTPTGIRGLRSRPLLLASGAVVLCTGLLGAWLAASAGMPALVIAVVYLAGLSLVLLARWSGRELRGTYRVLRRSSVALAAILAATTGLAVLLGHSPWPALLLTILVLSHALSVDFLWRSAAFWSTDTARANYSAA